MKATILISADIDEVPSIHRRLKHAGFTSLYRLGGIYDLAAEFDFENVGRLRFQIMEVIHRQSRPREGNVDRTVTLLHLDPDDSADTMVITRAHRATVLVTVRVGSALDAQQHLRDLGASRVSLVTGIYDLVAVVDRDTEEDIQRWSREVLEKEFVERTVTLIHLPDLES